MSAPPSGIQAALAKDRLGAASVASFALTAAAPLMVVGGFLVASWSEVGVSGFPLALILMGIVLALFSLGYVAMARRITNAGAFYSYVAQGLGRPVGVGASLVALLAYNALQFGLYGLFGWALSGFLEAKGIAEIPWWTLALATWAITAIFGMLRVDFNSKVLLTILAGELAVVLVYNVGFLSNPAAEGISFAAFSPDNLFVGSGAVAAVAVVMITCFIGFEAAPVFAEESKDKRRTIPAATFAGLIVMLLAYTITSWAITVAAGPSNVVAAATEDPDLMFSLAGTHLGAFWGDAGAVLLITSAFAAMLSYHNTVARYTFSLAREGVLPRILSTTGARSGAPVAASMVQSALGLTVIIIYAIGGWDPFTRLFFWGGAMGGFGVLMLLIATSLAVIGYFWRHPEAKEHPFTWIIAPIVAVIALGYVFIEVTRSFHNLLGVSSDSAWWIAPGLFLLLAIGGVLWGLTLRSVRPDVYAMIGRGADAQAGPSDEIESGTDAPEDARASEKVAP